MPTDLVVATGLGAGLDEGEVLGKAGEDAEVSFSISDGGVWVLLIGFFAGPFLVGGDAIDNSVVDFLDLVPLEGAAEGSGGAALSGEEEDSGGGAV